MVTLGKADLILVNGQFHTVDRENPVAEAVAVRDGKFLEVGTVAEVMQHHGDGTKVVDLKGHTAIPGLNDSKKLTDKKRRELYDIMIEQAVSYGIAFASEQEIDEINILQATFLAMERAMQQLSPQPELALIDGNRTKDFGLPVRTIVKGDSLSASIAAASILAKVTRDRLMEEYDAQYPQYGFAVHKGYGTKRHYEALREFGPSPIHRKTFLKKFYENP